MVDVCRITRPGTPVLDRSTGQVTTPETVLYEGPCRLQPQRTPSPAEAGEQAQVIARYIVSLPFDATPAAPLEVADLLTVTASGDPRAVGVAMPVMTVDYGSTATAWRLTVQDGN
jgi:hypothetical protein